MGIFSRKKNRSRWRKIGAVVLAVLVLGTLALVFFPKGNEKFMSMEESAPSLGGVYMDMAQDSVAYEGASRNAMSSLIAPMEPSGAPDVADRQVIRVGNLSLVVLDVEASIENIKEIVLAEDKGFVAESSVQQVSDDTKSGWITVRVPSGQFEDVMTAIKEIAEKVESENVRLDDVTKQLVDMEARLVNLRAQEEQYRKILETADTVEETLMVTDSLNRVRYEIESLDNQVKTLGEQVNFSTISVSLVDQGDVEVFGIYWKPLVQVKQALRGALENATASVDFLFVILFNLPLILIWGALLGGVAWGGWRLLQRVWDR